MSKVEVTPRLRPTSQLAGWVRAVCAFVKSYMQPEERSAASRPALLSFRECLSKSVLNFLLFGNGLVRQFGYETSTREICYHMARRNWCHWPLYFWTLVGVEEFERLLMNKSSKKQSEIKFDFAIALIEIMGDAGHDLLEAAEFLNEFDEVFTLNYDTFTARLRSLRHGDSMAELDSSTWETLQFEIKQRKFPRHGGKPKQGMARASSETTDVDNFAQPHASAEEIEQVKKFTEWLDGFLWLAGRRVWEEGAVQNFRNMHGSFDYFILPGEPALYKYDLLNCWTKDEYLELLNDKGGEMLFIMEPDSASKVEIINQHGYFRACIQRLRDIEGNLFIYGVDFRKLTDEHIWQAIRENGKIKNIYIAVSPDDQTCWKDIKKLLPDCDKVHFFDWNIR